MKTSDLVSGFVVIMAMLIVSATSLVMTVRATTLFTQIWSATMTILFIVVLGILLALLDDKK